MKKEIHPAFYTEATVECACGATFAVGSTQEKLSVEICGNCHPFYTGHDKVIDTAGRVEKFKARTSKAGPKTMPKRERKATKAATREKKKTEV